MNPSQLKSRILLARDRGPVRRSTSHRAWVRQSARVPATYSKDLADRITGATALVEGLPLLTADREIRRLRALHAVW